MASAEYQKEWRAKNAERIRGYDRAYYLDHKEKKAAQQKRSRDRRREEIRAKDREYYHKHKERYAAQAKGKHAKLKQDPVRWAARRAYLVEYSEKITRQRYRDDPEFRAEVRAKVAKWRKDNIGWVRQNNREYNSRRKCGEYWEAHRALVEIEKEVNNGRPAYR